jgi:hypothetical protein
MVRSLVGAVKLAAAIQTKTYGQRETVAVSLTAKGNSGGVNPTKTKCERPLR